MTVNIFPVVTVFLVGAVFVLCLAYYFKKSIMQLRDYSHKLSKEMIKSKDGEKLLAQQKDKLLMHVQASAEGICFFNPNRTVAFYNGLFLQNFNIISNNSVTIGKEILLDECFKPVAEFLQNRSNEEYFETHISKQGRDFLLRMNVFEDKSFEMILVDVTAMEKTRRLKQEMTGNIAHELRTPVTSIRGFLEILINNHLPEEKKQEYMRRAFLQTQVLSELISDMSLLTKIDEKADSLQMERVNISEIIARVYADTQSKAAEKNITFKNEVPEDIIISGNSSLLYSIFRNLADNVIIHAGNDACINIKINEIKDGRAYFIFADNGKGIAEENHLSRLFERFYRVHEGRSRDTGGSGLGLSIVKNAVLFHGGNISVKNGKEKGLEFLFSLTLAK